MKKLILILIALILFSGCATKLNVKHDIDPAEPIRVAILPFYQVNDKGEIVNSEIPLFQTKAFNAQFEARDPLPSERVQQFVLRELEKTNLDIVPESLVRADLVHHLYVDGTTYDYNKILAADPAALCKVIVCDAVLYGKVTEWDQSYYIAQSVSTVGIELKLIDAKTKRELLTADVEDSDSRGLTKGPTGFASLALEPLKGLQDSVIEDLAANVVEKALKPIVAEEEQRKHDTPAPVVIATSHSAGKGRVTRSEPLIVLATGTAGVDASFSIGDVVRSIPMDEVEPGHYAGEYYPLRSDNFTSASVVVSLRDRYGRVTDETVAITPITLQ